MRGKAEDGGRRTEDGRRKTEDGGRRTEKRGRKIEDRVGKKLGIGQSAVCRGQAGRKLGIKTGFGSKNYIFPFVCKRIQDHIDSKVKFDALVKSLSNKFAPPYIVQHRDASFYLSHPFSSGRAFCEFIKFAQLVVAHKGAIYDYKWHEYHSPNSVDLEFDIRRRNAKHIVADNDQKIFGQVHDITGMNRQ